MPVGGYLLPIIFAIFSRCFAYFLMNQLNMWRKTVFGCFMQIGSYIWQIPFGRFMRKTLERAAFIVTMSALVFWSRAFVTFSVLR